MKNQSRRIIVFGDEVGLPTVLQILSEVLLRKPDACVIDPQRKAVQSWWMSNSSTVRILLHPKQSQRDIFVRELAKLKPSLGIMFSYSRILWPELIDMFPLGIVNLHAGKLPEYRGGDALQWAIINGKTQTAMTLHYVDAGIDTGPVITQHPIAIDDNDTAATLNKKMCLSARAILKDWLPKLISGKVAACPQDKSRARTWPRRKLEDNMIDWSWPVGKIRDLIRASIGSWAGAYYIDSCGKKITIDRLLSHEEISALRSQTQR